MKNKSNKLTKQTNKNPGNCNLDPSSQEDQLYLAKSTLGLINAHAKLGYFSGGFTAFEGILAVPRGRSHSQPSAHPKKI